MFHASECAEYEDDEEVGAETLWVFVYGTLRPGYGNYDWYIKDAVSWTIYPATIQGRLYHVQGGSHTYPIYPVAKVGEEGTIQGVLLGLDPGQRMVERMIAMELAAGYEAVAADVSYGTQTITAAVFHYPGTPGPLIASGDWATVSPPEEG